MFVNGKKIAKVMEELFPTSRAYDWDAVGFQIGNPDGRVDRILLALELTDKVIDEAIEQGAEMIITHHPLLFRPLKRLVTDDPVGRLAIRLIEEGIALYCAHTNLDVTEGGTNDMLFRRLGLSERKLLQPEGQRELQKLVVYGPAGEKEVLLKVLEESGAGTFGAYAACSFSVKGEGTFRPLAGATPAVGVVGEKMRVDEVRMEALVKKEEALSIVERLKMVHPYETMAYDLFDLDPSITSETWGLGLTGTFEKPMAWEAFIAHVKKTLAVEHLRVVRSKERSIRRVALCTGAGADLITRASRAGADVLLTADVKYHEAMLAEQLRLNVVDAGHFSTEHLVREGLSEILRRRFEQKHYDVALSLSTSEQDPFTFL